MFLLYRYYRVGGLPNPHGWSPNTHEKAMVHRKRVLVPVKGLRFGIYGFRVLGL